jgi:membrane-associated phospholipid phosphatase
VAHVGGRQGIAYLEACGAARAVDWLWIVQPDGRVQKFGVAIWNDEPQDPPAPGAWLWAPSRGSGFSDRFSERFVRFLATQGPAEDSSATALELTPKTASLFSQKTRSSKLFASDWGETGLLQTPTARMGKQGDFTFHTSAVHPYTRYNILVQPLDWIQAGFRYTDIRDQLYADGGPKGDGATDQSFKDKGFDVKIRLWRESAYLPEVAIGARDVAGTGLFSGEYVVGNKRLGPFDISLGMGWGYLGRRGDVKNPLTRLFGSEFETRTGDALQTGIPGAKSAFRGRAAYFGGVQYQTPWDPLVFKLEYEGNDYRREPLGQDLHQRSPWNYGLAYRIAKWADLSLGFERGRRVQLGLTLHTDLEEMQMPKLADPPRVPFTVPRQGEGNWAGTVDDIQRQSGWHVTRIELVNRELYLTVVEAEGRYVAYRLDRIAAVLNRDAPAQVDRFVLRYVVRGLEQAEHVIDRNAWIAEQIQPLPSHLKREVIMARAPQPRPAGTTVAEKARPRFEFGIGPDLEHVIGGGDAFILYEFSAAARSKLTLREDTWIRGKWMLGLLNNYDKFLQQGFSELPPVRTNLREYVTTSRFKMPQLQLTHVGNLTDRQYYSVYGGYFEQMFGGVGAEWLYRPFNTKTAVGVDVNHVRQRAFDQGFEFLDYTTTTGHASLYLDTGWNDILLTLRAGRYLAKDLGATFEVSRVFKNGVSIGAFATKTNVSAAQFGEGTFDKGVYLSFPFEAILTRSTGTYGSFNWRPITRDGGARLARADTLYSVTSQRDHRRLWFEPGPTPNENRLPADRREPAQAQAKPAEPAPYAAVPPKPTAPQWTINERYEHSLVQALYRQDFRDIQVDYDSSHRLNITASNETLKPVPRAMGRAARTALRHMPVDTRELRITLRDGTRTLATYEFIELSRLERFFAGSLPQAELVDYVAVYYADASARPADPLAGMDDLRTNEASRPLAAVVADSVPAQATQRVVQDSAAAVKAATETDWVKAAAIGTGLVVGSSLFDRTFDRFAQDRVQNSRLSSVVQLGNAIPYIGFGAAAIVALEGSDPVRSRTGFAAVEAGAAAFAVTTGLKFAVGRARPTAGLGRTEFDAGARDDAHHSFPSRHAAVAWAVATPFAQQYGWTWPYVAAGLTTLSRTGSREHWFSDAVAGSALGYGLGRIFYESSRERHKDAPRVMLNPQGVTVGWDLQ